MESAQRHFELKDNDRVYFETDELHNLTGGYISTVRVTEDVWEQAIVEISRLNVIVDRDDSPVSETRSLDMPRQDLRAAAQDRSPPVDQRLRHLSELKAPTNPTIEREGSLRTLGVTDISSDEEGGPGVHRQDSTKLRVDDRHTTSGSESDVPLYENFWKTIRSRNASTSNSGASSSSSGVTQTPSDGVHTEKRRSARIAERRSRRGRKASRVGLQRTTVTFGVGTVDAPLGSNTGHDDRNFGRECAILSTRRHPASSTAGG